MKWQRSAAVYMTDRWARNVVAARFKQGSHAVGCRLAELADRTEGFL